MLIRNQRPKALLLSAAGTMAEGLLDVLVSKYGPRFGDVLVRDEHFSMIPY